MAIKVLFRYDGVDTEIDDPLNWADLYKVIKRSSEYDGISYVFTDTFEFTGNAINIIDTAKDAGLQAELEMFVFEWVASDLDWGLVFKGFIDLPNAKKTVKADTGEVYECTTVPTGIERNFDNDFGTELNLAVPKSIQNKPLVAPAFEWVKLKALPIKKDALVQTKDQNFLDAGSNPYIYSGPSDRAFYWTLAFDQVDRQEFGSDYKTLGLFQTKDNTQTINYLATNEEAVRDISFSNYNLRKYNFLASVAGEYTVDWNFWFTVSFNLGDPSEVINKIRFKCLLVHVDNQDPDNPVFNITEAAAYVDDATGGLNTFTFGKSGNTVQVYNLNAGDEIYAFPYMFVQGDDNSGIDNNWSIDVFELTVEWNILSITANTQFEDTINQGMLAFEAFSYAVSKITGEYNKFDSSFYGRTDSAPRTYVSEGEGALTAFMNGTHIRGWKIGDTNEDERGLFVSLEEMFESETAKHNLGIGVIDDEVVIEKKSFFYQDVEICDLGCIEELSIEVDREAYYNTVEIGYATFKNRENKEGAGLQEFNARKTYGTQLTVINNPLSVISPYVSAGYLIETTRREARELDLEKETQNDLQGFTIALLRTAGAGTQEDPAFVNETWSPLDVSNPWYNVEGVDFPENVYNKRWQPTRMIQAWGNVLALSLIETANKTLLVESIDGNRSFGSRLKTESALVMEDGDIAVNTLEDPLFNGDLYSFKKPLTSQQVADIEANPLGYISFTDARQRSYKGYLGGQVKINLDSREAEFQLKGKYE